MLLQLQTVFNYNMVSEYSSTVYYVLCNSFNSCQVWKWGLEKMGTLLIPLVEDILSLKFLLKQNPISSLSAMAWITYRKLRASVHQTGFYALCGALDRDEGA